MPKPFARIEAVLLAAALAAALAAPAGAADFEFLPVGDPLEFELRVLDVLGTPSLARLHSRPYQHFELPAAGGGDIARRIALERLGRFRARDAGERGPGTTPRLIQNLSPDSTLLEISAGIEGRGEVDEDDSRFARGSGFHVRTSARVDRWLLHSHLVAGHYPGGQAYADPLVDGTDFLIEAEESSVVYSPAGGRWSAWLGRGRWHWGPGEEASLLLSKTSPALTGLAARASLPSLRLDFTALNVTLGAAGGEQLAAHRVEWQPCDALRVGVSEAARYRSDSWRPLYAAAVIPYVLVQRLEAGDEPDSSGALRNNVVLGLDASWRLAPGTRVYGELLVDDLHSETADNPDKLAFQLGLDGVGVAFGRRATWGAEFTRLTRWVYTSFFGRTYAAHGEPLGFPTGPDARRLRVRGALDWNVAVQLLASAALTDRGAETLDDPYVPGDPDRDAWSFAGGRNRAREVEIGGRWWPVSGVDMTLTARWMRVAPAQGRAEELVGAALALRLIR